MNERRIQPIYDAGLHRKMNDPKITGLRYMHVQCDLNASHYT